MIRNETFWEWCGWSLLLAAVIIVPVGIIIVGAWWMAENIEIEDADGTT